MCWTRITREGRLEVLPPWTSSLPGDAASFIYKSSAYRKRKGVEWSVFKSHVLHLPKVERLVLKSLSALSAYLMSPRSKAPLQISQCWKGKVLIV